MTTTNIDEFLAKQKRFKCDRLNAMLTREHCDHNRKSGKIISCKGCPRQNTKETKTVKKTTSQPRKPVDGNDVTQNTPEPSPPVTNHEIHIVNLIEVFKQKQATELEMFQAGLSKLPDPYDKLKFCFEVCK